MSLLIGFLPGLARLFARPLCSLSLSLSVALLTRPPLPPSSTSNAATSFHPRKRAKLPQVLYLLCLATLVSTHKHDSLFLSLSLARSFDSLRCLCPSPPLAPHLSRGSTSSNAARCAKLRTNRRHCLSWNISNPPLHPTASINLLA